MSFVSRFCVVTISAAVFVCASIPFEGSAQDTTVSPSENLLTDRNGDGKIVFAGFGDSLTYGVGDGATPGIISPDVPFTNGSLGYVPRVGSFTGIQTVNRGNPGELLTTGGIFRVPGLFDNDIFALMEGVNDANLRVAGDLYQRNLQKAINVVKAAGRTPLLLTLPPPCCDHASLAPIARDFSNRIRAVAQGNEVTLVDIERGWDLVCGEPEQCPLYNRPEGLHPNTRGYDLIADLVAARLFSIDLFSVSGPEELAAAAGIPPEQVVLYSPPLSTAAPQ